MGAREQGAESYAPGEIVFYFGGQQSYMSYDFGEACEAPSISMPNITSAAMSRCGRYVLAVAWNTHYQSQDFGKTWTTAPPEVQNQNKCAMSPCGQYRAIYLDYCNGGIRYSPDFGITWSNLNVPNRTYRRVCLKGQHILLTSWEGTFMSNDYGATFTLSLSNSWGAYYAYDAAMSDDGTQAIVAGAEYWDAEEWWDNKVLYMTRNTANSPNWVEGFGTVGMQNPFDAQPFMCAMSSSGKYRIIGHSNESYLSSNHGVNYAQTGHNARYGAHLADDGSIAYIATANYGVLKKQGTANFSQLPLPPGYTYNSLRGIASNI